MAPRNELHEHVVNAPSLDAFKNRIDIYWSKQPMLLDHTKIYEKKYNHTPENWKKEEI